MKLFSLFLIFSLIVPDLFAQTDYAFRHTHSYRKKARQSKNTTRCATFDNGRKLSLNFNISYGNKKSKSKNVKPQVTCQEDLWDDYENAIDDKKKACDDAKDLKAKIAELRKKGKVVTKTSYNYQWQGYSRHKKFKKFSDSKIERRTNQADDLEDDLVEANDKCAEAKEESKSLYTYWKSLCTAKTVPNACPEVKEKFKENPSVKSFEEMIKTVGAIQYGGNKKEVDYRILSVDDFDKKTESYKELNGILKNEKTAKDAFERFQDNNEKKIEKTQSAWESYKKKDGKIEGACGGCSDLKSLIRSSMDGGDKDGIKELIKLANEIGCKDIPNAAKSCADEMKSKTNKNYKADAKGSYSSLTTLDSYIRNPMNASIASKFEEDYSKFSMKYDEESGVSCLSCDNLLESFDKYLSENNVDPENLNNESRADIKQNVKVIKANLISKSCIEPSVEKENPSCQELAEEIEVMAMTGKDPQNVSVAEQTIIDQAQEGKCCNPYMLEVKAGLKSSDFMDRIKTINPDDKNVSVSRFLGCFYCNSTESKNQKDQNKDVANKINSCDYYKSNPSNVGQSERFVCAEGPKAGSSCSEPNGRWAKSSFAAGGVYGQFIEQNLKMECYCDPRPEMQGKAVNLSCCDITEGSKDTLVESYNNKGDYSFSYKGATYNRPDKKVLCNNIWENMKSAVAESNKESAEICYETSTNMRLGNILKSEPTKGNGSSSAETLQN